MQSNQLASHDPAPKGNTQRIADIDKQADTTGFEDASPDQDPLKQQGAPGLDALSPVRLPARASENAIRYLRCSDPDCW